MKTIEQAARENASNNYHFKSSINWQTDVDTFKAGVEFSQQWINVKDMLPRNEYYILIKYYDGEISTGYYDNRERMFFIERMNAFTDLATHWRPIELK